MAGPVRAARHRLPPRRRGPRGGGYFDRRRCGASRRHCLGQYFVRAGGHFRLRADIRGVIRGDAVTCWRTRSRGRGTWSSAATWRSTSGRRSAATLWSHLVAPLRPGGVLMPGKAERPLGVRGLVHSGRASTGRIGADRGRDASRPWTADASGAAPDSGCYARRAWAAPWRLPPVLFISSPSAAMTWARLDIFPDRVLPIGYGVPLAAFLFFRGRRWLWLSVLAFAALSWVELFFSSRSTGTRAGWRPRHRLRDDPARPGSSCRHCPRADRPCGRARVGQCRCLSASNRDLAAREEEIAAAERGAPDTG